MEILIRIENRVANKRKIVGTYEKNMTKTKTQLKIKYLKKFKKKKKL